MNKIAAAAIATSLLIPTTALAFTPGHAYGMRGVAMVTDMSSPAFEYAHGTVTADDQFFIGMRQTPDNLYPTNEVLAFTDPADLSQYTAIHLPQSGDIESMVYDPTNDMVYAELANDHALDIYAIDPHTYAERAVISTTSVDVGQKPAIVTDGTYIYGITDSNPSTVFRVKISDGTLTTDSNDHIPDGHSAAIGIYATSTELYFGGGIAHGFEKVDAATLHSMAIAMIPACSMTDDMPYSDIDAYSGYVYVGCETEPYGERVDTSSMSYDQFLLPGESYGLFIYGDDLYNMSRDGYLDIFPGMNVNTIARYFVINNLAPMDSDGKGMELNELFYSSTTDSLYFTAWDGIKGLYRLGKI